MAIAKIAVILISLIVSSLSLGILLTILKIVKKLVALSDIGGKKIVFGIILVIFAIFLEAIHMVIILSDILGFVKPKIFVPPDIPYSKKYIFLWLPSSILYFLAYVVILYSISEKKFSTMSLVPYIFYPIPALLNIISSIILIVILFRLSDLVNPRSPIVFTISAFSISHLIQFLSFIVLHLPLYLLSIVVRFFGLLILYYGFLGR